MAAQFSYCENEGIGLYIQQILDRMKLIVTAEMLRPMFAAIAEVSIRGGEVVNRQKKRP